MGEKQYVAKKSLQHNYEIYKSLTKIGGYGGRDVIITVKYTTFN